MPPLTVSTALPWERSRSTRPSVASPIPAPKCLTSKPPTKTGGTRTPDHPPTTPTCADPAVPRQSAENLYASGPVYDYAVNIAGNPQRIPGRVAGIFLHVTDGNPTWGCVAIGRDEMRSLLNWLDPSASPQITIGVGAPSLVPPGS